MWNDTFSMIFKHRETIKSILCCLQRFSKFQIVYRFFPKINFAICHGSMSSHITNHFSSSAAQRNILSNATSYEHLLAVFRLSHLELRVVANVTLWFPKIPEKIDEPIVAFRVHTECRLRLSPKKNG